jgi:hypothetical protein
MEMEGKLSEQRGCPVKLLTLLPRLCLDMGVLCRNCTQRPVQGGPRRRRRTGAAQGPVPGHSARSEEWSSRGPRQDWMEVALRCRLMQRRTNSSSVKQGYLCRDQMLTLYNQNTSPLLD